MMDGFRDRADAARWLARELTEFRGKDALVLAIPRGAVPMGRILAEELDGELDVVLVRKVGAPINPELAVAAVDETGRIHRNDGASRFASEDWILSEARAEAQVIADRRRQYGRPPIDPAGRVVIVVDDGIATGSTMVAALTSLRERGPAQLVVATPVASPESLVRLEPLADRIVCLYSDPDFYAVGAYYHDFGQVSDRQVMDELRAAAPAGAT